MGKVPYGSNIYMRIGGRWVLVGKVPDEPNPNQDTLEGL